MRPKTTTSEDRSEERARTGARRSRGMNKSTISGRTVVITGAASGIGRALAQRLSAHSYPVAIADIDEKGLKETEASLNGPALPRVLDVADAEAQRDFAGEVRDWAPRPIGAVCNNAGVATAGEQDFRTSHVAEDCWPGSQIARR